MTYPVRIYNNVYSSKGDLIKTLFQRKTNGKETGIFSKKMVTAGISRKVFSSKKKPLKIFDEEREAQEG
jgi:hypothetical protein